MPKSSTRGLELGIERDNIEFLRKLYEYKGTKAYLDNYLKYWDDRIVSELVFSDKDGFAKDIFTRLYERRLFKRVFSERLKNIAIDGEAKDLLIKITSGKNEKTRRNIEKNVASLEDLKCEKDYVIVNSFTVKSVKEMSRNSEDKIMVVDSSGIPREFEDESTVFRSINDSMKDMYFEIYAPLEYTSRLDRNEKLERLKEQVLQILKGMEVDHGG